ncbi:MAG: hypothetical protein ABI978_07495, partial [Chloroflexota bacterium]
MRASSGRGLAATIVIGLALVACSNGSSGGSSSPSASGGQYPGWPGSGSVVANTQFVPIIVSSELGTGRNRVMITIQDGVGRTLAAQDVTVDERFYELATSTDTPAGEAAGTFRWLIPDSKAIYTSYADFAHPGDWGLEVTGHLPGKPDQTARVTFSVRDKTSTPAIGADAPPSETLSASDPAAIAAISTDSKPDPAFYA